MAKSGYLSKNKGSQGRNRLSGEGGSGDGPGYTARGSKRGGASPHTTGARRPNGERVGGPEVEGAGQLRMAGNIYKNPQVEKTKVNPAGGKFEGGKNTYKPPKMSTYSEE